MIPPRHVAQRGFTLLELIVAMTLAALIVALGANILRMGMDFYHRSHAYIHQQQEVRGFLRLLRDELQGATKGTLALSGEQFRLNFVTDNMPAGTSRGGQNNIILECRANDQGKTELIHRILLKKTIEEKEKKLDEIAKPGATMVDLTKVETGTTATQKSGGGGMEYKEEGLVHQLSWCAFSYLMRDEKGGKSKAAWVYEWLNATGLPLAVRVQLTPPGGNLPPVVIPLN